MENERITDEKTRQIIGYRHNLEETMSSTLPRSSSQGKKKLAPDSLSLVNEPSILSQGPLSRNNPLSSSLQDLSQTDGRFYDDNIQKSTSMASFEFTGSRSTSGIGSDFSSSNGSMQNFTRRFGLFSSKRVHKNPSERKLTKSAGSLEDIKSMRRKTSSTSDQRKSEFFVTSPIAT
ncbi:Hypothetical predicted protein [Paramuricea clavata]|uniref:Uncharacterized protein n=1 Tax=Paramuricea clavata TaxID=317549 RepID=A0A7D9L401_PARCT|nr:Hypothetical predicted protein [Paramuricea clavata]